MEVFVTGGAIDDREKQAYVHEAVQAYPGREIERIDIALEGDYVTIDACIKTQPFDRIRRITGYLVGTTQRFNNAKQAEERERIKHQVQ
jgi:hypothetical protein